MSNTSPPSRLVILLLALAGFASMASMRVTDAMLPALSYAFERPVADVAQNITFFAIAYGVMQLAYGPLGDRHGTLRVIGLATVACALGALGSALSGSLSTLLLFRTLTGATAAAIIPLSMAWVGDNVPYESRQVTLAHMLSGAVMGLITGQVAGGFLADTLGWQAAFYLLTTLFLLAGGLLLTMLHRRPGLSPPRSEQGGVAFVSRLREILLIARARRILVLVFLEGIAAFGALAFVASHLYERLGVSLTRAGLMVALFGVGGLIFAALARPLVRRLGEPGLAAGGGVLMGVGFVGLALAQQPIAAAAAAFAAGLGFYMMHSTLQINATQMAPAARGTAMAVFAGCLFLGQSVGVSLGGVILRLADSLWLLAGAGVWLLLLGMAFAWLLRQWRQAKPESPATPRYQ
ncbi:MFS transporter [Halomonas chromatireducens]|uniref:Multidrug export protein EmrB n=1 Tax=Halomonas chromatireducens TaxID=507626 RepID=A0A0X8HCD3_9GAMM|nr:MFS transporter [Halomonas chromatireducens]AMD00057.1 Multidrug export protein EmrB [Halomonas chromatireducens]